jgi:hypothetical protein
MIEGAYSVRNMVPIYETMLCFTQALQYVWLWGRQQAAVLPYWSILQLFYSAVSTIKFISQQIRLVQVINTMHTFSKRYTYYILTFNTEISQDRLPKTMNNLAQP